MFQLTPHTPSEIITLNYPPDTPNQPLTLTTPLSHHKERKQQLAKEATTIYRDHFYNSHHTANNKPTTIIPTPKPRLRAEMSVTRALKTLPAQAVQDSIAREIKKAQVTFKSLTPITRDQIQPKSQYLRSNIFIKQKRDGTISARLPIDGSSQTPDTYNTTYAGTSDAEKLLCLLSATVADAAHRQIPLQTGSFDIPAAFFGLPRSATNGFQLYTTLPKSLPSPLSGQLNEITGPQYGIKQSNGIFDKEFDKEMTNHNYKTHILSPHIYKKICPHNTANCLIFNMHVDDGAFMSTSPHLTIELKSILT